VTSDPGLGKLCSIDTRSNQSRRSILIDARTLQDRKSFCFVVSFRTKVRQIINIPKLPSRQYETMHSMHRITAPYGVAGYQSTNPHTISCVDYLHSIYKTLVLSCSLLPRTVDSNQTAHGSSQTNQSIIKVCQSNCGRRNCQITEVGKELKVESSTLPGNKVSKGPRS